MDLRQLGEVVNYQKTRFLEEKNLLLRNVLLERDKNIIDSKEIVIICGVRRCGKSSLMKIIAKKLIIERGIKKGNIGYLNFEDPQLIGFNINDCDKLYQVFLEESDLKSKFYLFLDEIQVLAGWERWLNKLYEFENVKIFLTGSNSSLLSSEISSFLTGRNRIINLYPFSFKESLDMRNILLDNKKYFTPQERSKIRSALEKYLQFGGFPEALKNEDTEILKLYYNDVIYKDIIGRNLARKKVEIMEFGLYLASNPGRILSTKKNQEMLGIKSHLTIKKYLEALESAYLFFKCSLFSYSIKKQIYNPSKAYMIDAAMSMAAGFQSAPNFGWAYENIVYIELRRRGHLPYYWKSSSNREVDFVIKQGMKIITAIQVCFTLNDFKVKEREIKALLDANKELKVDSLALITDDEEGVEKVNNCTITIIPLWKWLLT